MATITFDTLKFVHRLREAGIPEAQAEAISEAFADATSQELATKADVTAVRSDVKAEVARLEAAMREMELRITNNLTLRLGGMMAASVAIVAALVKMISH